MSIHDSNSQPLEHESPTITTRPGLPSYYFRVLSAMPTTSLSTLCLTVQ